MYSSESTIVRPCYLGKDHGLASLTSMDYGHCTNNFVSRIMTLGYGATSFVSSPRSGRRFYDARFEDQQPHFLQACFLCNKPLGDNSDIFMYRGDTPFCSEKCREEQIDIDEAKEKKKKLSSSMNAMRKKEQRKSGSPNKAQGYSFRTGAVAA
ncbi:hypothetical protein TanjilG_28072 [Lupinus angustifolius]|uniref:FLZ-type domain-containing protein n=1 Tax=Lupinus angustifolius TaxID=3871 RepID=A0A4P1RGM7_LUPAN|nr:PREDICTED: uncharacterized protein LOC109349598 [Lupinus angustifolius]OIW10321.1 hypothetical protein TanjilG_28072 [Lupinus angustifolius]